MLSFDEKNLQFLNVFYDFVKNPDTYKQLVDDLSVATKANQVALQDLNGGKDIQKFYDESMAAIQKSKDDLASASDYYDETVVKSKADLADKKAELDSREQLVASRENIVAKKESDVGKREVSVSSKLTDIDAAYDRIKALKDDLALREAALTAKAQQIKDLVG